MKRLFVAFVLCLPSFHVKADRPIGLTISGTDQYCTGYTPTVVNGATVLTCIPGGIPPGAPTNCVATVNSVHDINFAATGGTASLSVACTQTTGITYNWARNNTFGYNANRQWSEVLPANASPTTPVVTTYQVRPCIGANCVTVPTSPLTATVAASGSFSGSCPGFTNTRVINMNWASPPARYYPADYGGMGPNDAIVIQFNSLGSLPLTYPSRIGTVEWNSNPSARIATLSATPCDFGAQPFQGARIEGISINMTFYVSSLPPPGNYYPILTPNTVYYYNLRNAPNASCVANDNCNVVIELTKAPS